MMINGTDFRIPQQGLAKEGNPFGSHKYAGKSALRYELGVSILGGDLVWIQGPYPAGTYTDITIFNKVLCNFLEPGKRVEADKGYAGHADKIVCPTNAGNPPELKEMQGRVRVRHETLNGRLKNWGILSQVFRHHITLHGTAFRACAVVTQITIADCARASLRLSTATNFSSDNLQYYKIEPIYSYSLLIIINTYSLWIAEGRGSRGNHGGVFFLGKITNRISKNSH